MTRAWLWLGLVGCGDGIKAPKDLDAISTSSVPSKRSEILAVGDESLNSVLIFGGQDGPIVNQLPSAAFRDDTWIFEPGTGWTEVTADAHPSARGRYAAELDPVNHRVLLFGGRFREANTSGNYEVYNDLWSFDLATRTWSLADDGTAESAPAGRYYPSSAYDADTGRFYIWGGALNRSSTNINPGDDFWVWDGAAWTELETSGDAPSTRTFLGDTYDPVRKRIVIFGGQRGDFSSLAFQDTYALDVTTGAWTQLHDGSGTAPSTRMHAHLEYDPATDTYLLFGGHTDVGDMNDLWSFDPDTNAWTMVYEADRFTDNGLGCAGNSSEVPADYVEMDLSAPERRHRGMYVRMWNNLWVFGGIHAECSDYLDDTWRYDLAENAWHEVIGANSGEACARSGDDCECLCF
jgi:N-acetylneuraminic acid mutarotase